MRWVSAIFVFLLIDAGAYALPPRLLTANFSGGCHSYTIKVTGEGLEQTNLVVSYNVTLTPRSGGEPMIITDSFDVSAAKNGRFRKSFQGSWKKFGFEPAGKFTLSGSAILISGQRALHTLAIAFSQPTFDCNSKPSPP